MRVHIMNDSNGDIVATFDTWDEAMEWLDNNQENFMYTPFEGD